LATCLVHFLVPTPATSARENTCAACISGSTTFFTCFRLSFRQSASEAFTPAVINVPKVPALTFGPGCHWPPLHWSARVPSLPSLHEAVFAACRPPVAGSHTSSVQGLPSSQEMGVKMHDPLHVSVVHGFPSSHGGPPQHVGFVRSMRYTPFSLSAPPSVKKTTNRPSSESIG